MELVYLLLIIGVLIAILYFSIFIWPNETESNENEKKEKEVQKEERLIDKFNKISIGQSFYEVKSILGKDYKLEEERLLREEKLLHNKDVVKKVYVWKFNGWKNGWFETGYIRCTFYNDRLSAKEQRNL